MRRVGLIALLSLLLPCLAQAQSVLVGDPIDPATGNAYVIPSTAPLFAPGEDEKYGTDDDVLAANVLGDVDLVLRTSAFGPVFPLPAAGVAAAPVIVAGGAAAGQGSDAFFQVSLSDGATPPATGHPLAASDLNGRGVLVLAYADLDGDGILGPTSTDGDADAQVELQEILDPVGRQVAVLADGTALGDIGISLGAPASAGGLGVVLVAAALAGSRPPLFTEGPFVATALPLLPPVEVRRIVTGNARPPDPEYLVDIELEIETGEAGRWFVPGPNDVVPGEPYALSLTDVNPTVDLVQARAGAATGALLVRPLGSAFVAALGRRVLPGVGAGGARLPLEVAESLTLADDGLGQALTLGVIAADVLGNPTDPPAEGLDVVVEVGSSLAIVSPDVDHDPRREPLTLTSAEGRQIVLDDAGVAGDGSATDRVTLLVGGVPTASAALVLQGGATAALPLARLRIGLRQGGNDFVRLRTKFLGTSLDAGAQDVTVSITGASRTLYSRTFPAISLASRPGGNRYSFRDPRDGVGARVTLLLARTRRAPNTYALRLLVRDLDLAGLDASASPIAVVVRVGADVFQAPLTCTANAAGTASRCAL